MKQRYRDQAFRGDTLRLIELINLIVEEYTRQRYRLTVRQLYYQLVARGYPSASCLREFALQDIVSSVRAGQKGHIIRLGDHDPSGIDMSRDLVDLLSVFSYG